MMIASIRGYEMEFPLPLKRPQLSPVRELWKGAANVRRDRITRSLGGSR